VQANKAAIKALLVNKIGDCFILFAIGLTVCVFKTTNFIYIFNNIDSSFGYNFIIFNYSVNSLVVICFFIFLGAMAKSAQLGLHTWLPDAMEGPTPVSALIHAATMVTAGVFLMIRFGPVFSFCPIVLDFVVFIGALTCLFGAIVAAFQFDIKKIIAYSTCSQLGYMVMACGLSAYGAAMFHLTTHAFFKALLFLSAGSVIHALSDEQDIRKMGGLIKLLPITYINTLFGSLALAGFPFFSGFYSKEMILEIAYKANSTVGTFGYCLGILAAFLTCYYSIRLLYFVFLRPSNVNKNLISNVHEPSNLTNLVLFFLVLLSMFLGNFASDFFFSVNSAYNLNFFELPLFIKILPIFFSFAGIFLSYLINYRFANTFFMLFFSNPVYNFFFFFFNKKLYFDLIYNNFISIFFFKKTNNYIFDNIDKGWLEYLGPSGISSFISYLSCKLSYLHGGFIYRYTAWLFFGSSFLICLVEYIRFYG
jgi:proton-translocating NADH-quinone oxidoreductase chain L